MNATIWFDELRRNDLGRVGGKNASLGELVQRLTQAGVSTPPGFATTASAYSSFVSANGLDEVIASTLRKRAQGSIGLSEAGREIRSAFLNATWPEQLAASIKAAYEELCRRCGVSALSVAVRSSATAEDLPEASFAGQQESFLNVCGADAVLDACLRCYASLFTNRAITYREIHGFAHDKVALSVGVQRMVRADLAGSGVMFTIDTETGFDRVVIINAAWGLGENVVQGAVNPDETHIFKPLLEDPGSMPIIRKSLGTKEMKMICGAGGHPSVENLPTSPAERASFVLTDEEALSLARWGVAIEKHYGCAMDIEWAKDGVDGRLFVVQARPETVQSRRTKAEFRSYRVSGRGPILCSGVAIGDSAVSGPVCVLEDARDIARFVPGSVLVARTTDPDWVPIMKAAKAIVTDQGGRTSHAAIVSRELGLPAIVGCRDATEVLEKAAM